MHTFDKALNLICGTEPTKVWVMDNTTLLELKRYKNKHGDYLWMPSTRESERHGTFMGIAITITDTQSFKLAYDFIDGHEHSFEIDVIDKWDLLSNEELL